MTFSITKTDSKQDTAGGSPITYNAGGNPSIGTSDPNRVIVIAIGARTGNALGVTGVTVNGNAATQAPSAASPSNSMSTDIWYITESAAGTSGLTTAAVVVTYNTATLRSEIVVYSVITTAATPTAGVNGTGVSGASVSAPPITVPSGGGAIAIEASRTNSGNAATWSGASTVADVDDVIAATHQLSSSHDTANFGSQTFTVSYSPGTGGDYAISAVAWGAGGGGGELVAPTRRIFTRRKRPEFTGWNPIRDFRTRSALIVPERKLLLPRNHRKAA